MDNFVFRPAKNTDLFKCLQNTESLLEHHHLMSPTNGSMGVHISGGTKAFLKRASLKKVSTGICICPKSLG